MQSATCTILRTRRPCPASPLIPFEWVLMLLCVRPASQNGFKFALRWKSDTFLHILAQLAALTPQLCLSTRTSLLSFPTASAAKIRYPRLSNFLFLSSFLQCFTFAHMFGAQRANFATQRSSLNNCLSTTSRLLYRRFLFPIYLGIA
jgi:hypothetical protein